MPVGKILIYFLSILLITPLLTACGLDRALNYKTRSAASYSLEIADNSVSNAKTVFLSALKEENLDPVFISDIGGVELYLIEDESSRITITIDKTQEIKALIENSFIADGQDPKLLLGPDFASGIGSVWISIYPSRWTFFSKERKTKCEEKRAAILRTKTVLENSETFNPRHWETHPPEYDHPEYTHSLC